MTFKSSDAIYGEENELSTVYASIEGQGYFLTLAQGGIHIKFELGFLRKYCADLHQTLYESFQVQGNENLMT